MENEIKMKLRACSGFVTALFLPFYEWHKSSEILTNIASFFFDRFDFIILKNDFHYNLILYNFEFIFDEFRLPSDNAPIKVKLDQD